MKHISWRDRAESAGCKYIQLYAEEIEAQEDLRPLIEQRRRLKMNKSGKGR